MLWMLLIGCGSAVERETVYLDSVTGKEVSSPKELMVHPEILTVCIAGREAYRIVQSYGHSYLWAEHGVTRASSCNAKTLIK